MDVLWWSVWANENMSVKSEKNVLHFYVEANIIVGARLGRQGVSAFYSYSLQPDATLEYL